MLLRQAMFLTRGDLICIRDGQIEVVEHVSDPINNGIPLYRALRITSRWGGLTQIRKFAATDYVEVVEQ